MSRKAEWKGQLDTGAPLQMFEDRRHVQQKGDDRKGGCVSGHGETIHRGG